MILCILIFDRYVVPLNIAGFLQALEKRNDEVLIVIINGFRAEEPYHRHRLLRPRRERPRRRAPEPRYELSAFDHSITSSARSKID